MRGAVSASPTTPRTRAGIPRIKLPSSWQHKGPGSQVLQVRRRLLLEGVSGLSPGGYHGGAREGRCCFGRRRSFCCWQGAEGWQRQHMGGGEICVWWHWAGGRGHDVSRRGGGRPGGVGETGQEIQKTVVPAASGAEFWPARKD